MHPEQRHDNRRRYFRVPLRARCWCETEGVTLFAKIQNVSEGGLFVYTFEPLKKGCAARVRFSPVKGGEEICADAVVVWVRTSSDGDGAPGMGMRFVRMDPESNRRLHALVAGLPANADASGEG